MMHASRATTRPADGPTAAPGAAPTAPRPTLLQALRRAHLRLGLIGVIAAAVTLTLLSVLTLRTYVDRNLALIARSIAYAAEAAVMFDDSQAAQDALQAIAGGESLLAAAIVRPDGSRLAHYRHEPARALDETLAEFGGVLFQLQAARCCTRATGSGWCKCAAMAACTCCSCSRCWRRSPRAAR